MKRLRGVIAISSVFVLGAWFGARTMNAQDIPYDRELWPLENAYIDAAMQGDLAKRAAFWHDEYLGWPAGEDRPWDKKYGVTGVQLWYDAHGGKLSTPMLEPIASRVLEDIGITHYRLEYTVTSPEGKKSKRINRVTHVWLKTNDGWKLFGGATSAE